MSLWNPKKWVKARMPRSGAPVVPLYTVTKKFEEYEERAYPHTYWCTTMLHGMEQAKPIAFRRLLDYTSGYNSRGERFQFSAPIVWTMTPKGEPVSVSVFIGLGPKAIMGTSAANWPPPKPTHGAVQLEEWPAMNVYVSRFLDKSNACWWPAPEPSDANLFVECWPATIIYARPFHGTAHRKDWARETYTLTRNLPRVHRFNGYRMHCEYDDVLRPIERRRNEVWIVAMA